MFRTALPVLAALAALASATPQPAAAETVLTPADVSPAGATFPCQRAGVSDVFWSCLAAAGVPPGGILFTHWLNANPQINEPGIATDLIELGPVDLAELIFPFRANTNQQMAFVNGADGVLLPQALTEAAPTDPQSVALRTAYPQAFGDARLRVAGLLTNGAKQRFVLVETLVDGCRACAVIGAEIRAVEFDGGVLQRVETLGWIRPPMAEDDTRDDALRQGNLQALQVALTLRGYQPGLMDGTERPETSSALAQFMSDNCEAPEPTATRAAIELLAAPGPYLETPRCRAAETVAE